MIAMDFGLLHHLVRVHLRGCLHPPLIVRNDQDEVGPLEADITEGLIITMQVDELGGESATINLQSVENRRTRALIFRWTVLSTVLRETTRLL